MAQPTYHINQPQGEIYRRRYRRRRRLLAAFLILLLAAVVVVIHDIYRLQQAGDKKPIGATYTQTVGGPQTFRSAYFEFSDTAKWVFAPNDSTPNKLTYLLYVSGVPAHALIVYINHTPLANDLAVTRALPVQLKNGNSFSLAGAISPNCGSLYAASDLKHIKTVSLAGTSILCVPDSPQYTVAVGQLGGDYRLQLRRHNGQIAQYIVIYQNLSANPDPAPFLRIMKTFKAL